MKALKHCTVLSGEPRQSSLEFLQTKLMKMKIIENIYPLFRVSTYKRSEFLRIHISIWKLFLFFSYNVTRIVYP